MVGRGEWVVVTGVGGKGVGSPSTTGVKLDELSSPSERERDEPGERGAGRGTEGERIEGRVRAEEEDLEDLERIVGLETREGEATRLGEGGVKVIGSTVTSMGCVAIWSSVKSTAGEEEASMPKSVNWTVGISSGRTRTSRRCKGGAQGPGRKRWSTRGT